MKLLTLLIAISCFLHLSAFAQEGNDAVNNILRNKNVQDILRAAKTNPEGTLNAAKENPKDIVRNVTAIFADQQSKNNPSAAPATRSSKSQTDKALANLRKRFTATPVVTAQPVTDAVKDLKVDTAKLNQVKAAARDLIPGITDKLQPIDPPTVRPAPIRSTTINPAPPRPAPAPIASRANTSPLNINPSQAPPIPIRSMEATTPQIPDSPELYSSSVPTPKALTPRYPKPDKFQPSKNFATTGSATPKPSDETMVVTSNFAEMDRNKNTLTFKGDVVVEMKDMEMKCDNLLIILDDAQQMKEIIATGGMVQIKRMGEGNKLQVAKCRKAHHIKATALTVLSGGPPYLQDGDSYINTDSQDSRITLSGDGKYKVDTPKGKPGRSGRSVIVVPIKGAKKLTGDLGFENKMKIR